MPAARPQAWPARHRTRLRPAGRRHQPRATRPARFPPTRSRSQELRSGSRSWEAECTTSSARERKLRPRCNLIRGKRWNPLGRQGCAWHVARFRKRWREADSLATTWARALATGPITRPDIPRLIGLLPDEDAVEAPPPAEAHPPAAPSPSPDAESGASRVPGDRKSMVRLRSDRHPSDLPCAVLDIVTADGSRDPRREP